MYTFTDTLYDRRRRGPARKPVLRLCSSRRLVTFKAAKHAAMQLPCNIVLPPWKRPTSLLLSRVFHGLQTLSPPISRRALSLHSGLSCFPTLNWIECRIRPFGIGPRFSSADRNWTRLEKREIISQGWIYRHPVYRHGRRGTLDSATIPTRHGNYTGNTVLPYASLRSPWMGWILNSQRPRENRRSLDNDCHVRHGSSVVLIDHLFAP